MTTGITSSLNNNKIMQFGVVPEYLKLASKYKKIHVVFQRSQESKISQPPHLPRIHTILWGFVLITLDTLDIHTNFVLT